MNRIASFAISHLMPLLGLPLRLLSKTIHSNHFNLLIGADSFLVSISNLSYKIHQTSYKCQSKLTCS